MEENNTLHKATVAFSRMDTLTNMRRRAHNSYFGPLLGLITYATSRDLITAFTFCKKNFCQVKAIPNGFLVWAFLIPSPVKRKFRKHGPNKN